MRHQRGLDAEVETDGAGHQQWQLCAGRQPGRQCQHGERCQGQARTQAGHALRAAAVGQPACQRGGQRTGRTRQAQGAGSGAAHVELLVQHHGQRGPERAEGHRQQALCQCRAAQRRLAAPQLHHGAQQRAIAQLRGGFETGQPAPQGHPQQCHGSGGQQVDAAPAAMLGQQPADHARQQNAQQQPRHHRAHHLAALVLGRQRGGGRYHVLRQGGGQAHGQAGSQQRRQARSQPAGQQGQHQRGGLGQDDAPAVHAVAQRCQQQNAQRIAQLGQRGHKAHGAFACAQVGAEHPQHGLAVVERGHAHARRGRHQQHQRCRHAGALRARSGLHMRRLNRRHVEAPVRRS